MSGMQYETVLPDLDLFVRHSSYVRDIATWLEGIGYAFSGRRVQYLVSSWTDDEDEESEDVNSSSGAIVLRSRTVETLDDALACADSYRDSLDKRSFTKPTFVSCRSSDYDHMIQNIVSVLDFCQEGKTVQLISSRFSPLDIILSFHSSMSLFVLAYTFALLKKLLQHAS